MSHARRQEAYRCQFLVLYKLILESNAIRDVINDDQPPSRRRCFIHQGRDRKIHRQPLPLLLIEIPVLGKPLKEIRWNNFFCPALQGLFPPHACHVFKCLVPARDAALDALHNYAHVDRLDDVLVEILQVMIFGGS